MKRFLSLILALFLFVSAIGCSKPADPNGYPATIGDVVLNAKPVKIAVTSKALKNVIESLGFGSVTVDATAVFSTGVGDLTGGSDEVDVVLTNEDLYPAQKTVLTGAGVPVIKLKLPENMAEVRTYWETLGRIANGDKGAIAALTAFDRLFAELMGLKKVTETTAVVLYDKEHCAVSGLAAEALKTAGYRNSVESAEDMEMTVDRLKELDPEYIFIQSGMKDDLLADEDLKTLVAVANLQVFEIDIIGINFGSQKLFSEIKYMNSVAPVDDVTDGTVSGDADTSSAESTSTDSSTDE